MNTSPSYTTDVIYPSAFGAFQSPIHLAHAAWLGGRKTVDVSGAFRYADAEFIGVDLNPMHIAQARRLAGDAKLSNVTFHEASFSELSSLGLPQFDFIALAGIYSWLSPDLRNACLSFAQQHLAVDGALFLHYAALPGNAQIDALYTMIREAATSAEGDSVARYLTAIKRIQTLRDAGALFFRQNPHATAWLKSIVDDDPRSMAHEVLNTQRNSLSVRDVSEEARHFGLGYVANAQLELNDFELTMPTTARADIIGADPVYAQFMLDTMRAASSRMDVLMRSDAPIVETPVPDLWIDRLTVGPLLAERAELSKRAATDLSLDVYGSVLDRVNGKPARLRDLACDAAAKSSLSVEMATKRLLALKLIHLQRRPFASGSNSKTPKLASALNQLLLEERIDYAGALPLASPIAGTQVLLPPEDRLVLLFLIGGDFHSAWTRLSRSGQVIKLGGVPVKDPVALKAAAEKRTTEIGDRVVERLTRLGVLC
jgi:hypothetical protein